MADRLQDQLSYPPRAMDAERAARYVGTGKTKFLEMVQEGRMPAPFRYEQDMPRWDRVDLDAAVEDAKDQRRDPKKRERAKLQERLDAIRGDDG
jgi:predicted DNA-binding transcriptional regulator AlpA